MRNEISKPSVAAVVALAINAVIGVGSIGIRSALADPSGVFSTNVREEIDLSTPGASVALAWSRDGSALAATSNYGSTFTIWDKAGHLINRFARTGAR
jgi:hypothetical protein